MTPEDHRKLYFDLAKCIASVEPEYRADLCREFRISPKDVEASQIPPATRATAAGDAT
jgi:hypothetical protein